MGVRLIPGAADPQGFRVLAQETEEEMCQERLCLHLMDSLEAAFRGTADKKGGGLVGSWGREVMEALQYSCLKSKHPQSLIRQIALELLQGISFGCPCEGLAEGVLHCPERFLRAVVVLAAQCTPSSATPPRPPVVH